MESSLKIAVDTSMLTSLERLKLNIFEEAKRTFGSKVAFVIPKQVLQELDKLEVKSKRMERIVRIARMALARQAYEQVSVQARNADTALTKLAKKGMIIATNDKELRKQVKKHGGKSMLVRKTKLIITG